MRIAYVSGRYRAKTFIGIILNILRARWVAIKLWKMGYATICPHMNTALFPHWPNIKTDNRYIKGDLEFLDRLHSGKDCIVMLKKWRKSWGGAQAEKEFSGYRGLKIWYWPQDKEKLIRNAR